jgi:molybdate/tungstate transport system substrate-binding protein
MKITIGTPRVRRRGGSIVVALLAMIALLAGCGGGGTSGAAGGDQRIVRVLYAGSLVSIMEKTMGPAFAKATGDQYQGYGAGSSQIANELQGKIRQGDVFISADPAVDTKLMGPNGFVSWYTTFARSPLVLAYSPGSKFADQLKTKPWYEVVTQPGFRLGSTDPKLDPKGKLAAQAIQQIAKDQNQPGMAEQINRNLTVFPETDLVGRLQAGQLDAGFFYSIESADLGDPTASLAPINLAAQYTVTVLNQAVNPAGGEAFVKYLLGDQGMTTLKEHGFQLIQPPKVSGNQASAPKDLQSVVGAG